MKLQVPAGIPLFHVVKVNTEDPEERDNNCDMMLENEEQKSTRLLAQLCNDKRRGELKPEGAI